jgi:hypothetical protein
VPSICATFFILRNPYPLDAAHVHSPTGGQGLNTSVQDALNLAWKISLSLTYPSAPRTLLDSYETERLPVVRDMLFRTTELLKKTAAYKTQDGADVKHMRRPQILHQLGVNYRWSPVVVDEQPQTEEEVSGAYRTEDSSILRAGDRAPDSPGIVGEEKQTLFDIFKPTRHTVLLFSDDDETLDVLKKVPTGAIYTVRVVSRDETSSSGVDAVFVDCDGHVRTFYPPAANGFKTIIIRPDGVVGAIIKGKEGTERYLKVVFGL